ncbi:MAG: hypothetical protein DWQ34_28590 [Planctomycetota bacterium]|nr:MAG: hypothetical protein DWQ34_28590 [Planctomycetota bacterium]REJ91089.1 MAG: hypothetical protein DWQ29_06035 [Planctomycetota bacterium]REK21407.1 MAG: hypothetical protein DWQ41_21480 [Planctomycetota bacterium]REK40082.1 MAG: hypothetical protein DWQ45_00565 [Planctomycetota bacterium]
MHVADGSPQCLIEQSEPDSEADSRSQACAERTTRGERFGPFVIPEAQEDGAEAESTEHL